VAVNVIMKRTPKTAANGELDSVLQELGQLAMGRPGYISGETLLSSLDTSPTLVVSQWASLQHWQGYEICTERQRLLHRVAELLDEPAVTEVYLLTG